MITRAHSSTERLSESCHHSPPCHFLRLAAKDFCFYSLAFGMHRRIKKRLTLMFVLWKRLIVCDTMALASFIGTAVPPLYCEPRCIMNIEKSSPEGWLHARCEENCMSRQMSNLISTRCSIRSDWCLKLQHGEKEGRYKTQNMECRTSPLCCWSGLLFSWCGFFNMSFSIITSTRWVLLFNQCKAVELSMAADATSFGIM